VVWVVSQHLRCSCLSQLHSVMVQGHDLNPSGAVDSLKAVIVSLVLQLFPNYSSSPDVD